MIGLLAHTPGWPLPVYADTSLITQEIRYHMPDAGEVLLVWGINGWAVVSEEIRPAGTVVKDEIMNTPMVRENDTFKVKIQVPVGSRIDYGFWITKTDKGADAGTWEGGKNSITAKEDGIVEVQTRLTLGQGQVTRVIDNIPLGTQEIRYQMDGVDEVTLVWGIDGWILVPEAIRPVGTLVKEEVMHTPMVRTGNTYVVTVHVPLGDKIGYSFLIKRTINGTESEISDTNGDQGYQIIAKETGVTGISFVTQQIRYYLPEAGEVLIVWKLNGRSIAPEMIRPSGTIIENDQMYTPMIRDGGTFIANLQVPSGAAIDYTFQVVKSRSGATVEWQDTNNSEGYQTIVGSGSVTGIRAMLAPEQGLSVTRLLDVGLYLLGGILVVGLIGAMLYFAPIESRRAVVLVLTSLTLLGLGLRWWFIWNFTPHLPHVIAYLLDRPWGYEVLAYSLQPISFFKWPGGMPLYPFFLTMFQLSLDDPIPMIFYVQGVIGAVTIPLTYSLARRFTGPKLALLAAAMVALHPSFIFYVMRLSDDTIYTCLLLLELLILLRALEAPSLHRFGLAGGLLAVVCLCRLSTLLFPLLLLLLLPRHWNFKRKAMLCLTYAAPLLAVLALWSLQNYRAHQTFLSPGVLAMPLWQGSPRFYNLMNDNSTISQIETKYLDPERNGGHNPLTTEGDHYFFQQAFASISAAPDIYALYSFLKLAFFWIGHPAIDWPDYTVFNIDAMRPYFSAAQIAGILAARILPLVAIIGLIILHEVHHQIRIVVPLLVICGYFMVIYALTSPEVRYSEALHPLLATIIVVAVRPRKRVSTSHTVEAQRRWYYS